MQRTARHHRLGVIVLAASVALAACTSEADDAATAVCEPDTTEVEPLIGPEAQASSDGQIEAWALFFPTTFSMPNGEPIRIPEDREIKIAWRVTGSGDFAIEATGPDGLVIAPDSGPDLHSGSSWGRPGDEWGTGWTFPEPGCWTFRLQRGESKANLNVDITA